MKNGFRKLLATLCILAMLMSSFPAVFADGEVSQQPKEQAEQIIPGTAQEEPEAGEQPEAGEERPEAGEQLEVKNEPEQTKEAEGNKLPGADLPSEPEADAQFENNGVQDESGNVTPEDEDNEITAGNSENDPASEEGEQSVESQPEETTEEKPEEKQEEQFTEQPEEAEQSEKPAQLEEGEQAEVPEQPEESEQAKEPAQPEEGEQAEALEQSEEAEQSEKPAQLAEDEQAEEPEQPAEGEQAEGQEQQEETNKIPNELRLGSRVNGTLKAGEEYIITHTGRYSFDIILTLTLKQKNIEDDRLPGSKDSTQTDGIRVWFNGRQKELTKVENEDPDSTDVIYTFTTFTEKGTTYEIKIVSDFDSSFSLAAVKKPKEMKQTNETEQENEAGKIEDEKAVLQEEPSEDTKEEPEEEMNAQFQEESEEVVEEPTETFKENIDPDQTINLITEKVTVVNEELTEEDLLKAGYVKIQVVRANGTDIQFVANDMLVPDEHLELAKELWVKPTEDKNWALVYQMDKSAEDKLIRWDDVLIVLMKTEEITDEQSKDLTNNAIEEVTENVETDGSDVVESGEEPLARMIKVTTSLSEMNGIIPNGTQITMKAQLENFKDDDVYTCRWQYSTDGINYIDAEDANDLVYTYAIDSASFFYYWRVVIILEE